MRLTQWVVPLVGTWIEIAILETRHWHVWSFPLWERGLKYLCIKERANC